MIKLRNQSEEIAYLNNPKAQAADLNVAGYLVPWSCRIKSIFAKLIVAGITGAQTVDINKNGTTIFANAAKLAFATTSQAPTYDVFAANPTTFVKGDVISVDIDAVHSGTPAEGLMIELTLERTKTGPASTVAQTGGLGADAE